MRDQRHETYCLVGTLPEHSMCRFVFILAAQERAADYLSEALDSIVGPNSELCNLAEMRGVRDV